MDDASLDVPGLVRRVRRAADLSQRDLATRLEVSQATVARWETGEGAPSLAMFQRLVALAGWSLAVVDEGGEPVPPMQPAACRDRAHRRYAAHLDVEDFLEPNACLRRPRAVGRRARDATRARRAGAVPHDHPTWDELLAARREALARRREAQAARDCGRGRVAPVLPVCRCPGACFEAPACLSDCRCACEPPPRWADPGR